MNLVRHDPKSDTTSHLNTHISILIKNLISQICHLMHLNYDHEVTTGLTGHHCASGEVNNPDP